MAANHRRYADETRERALTMMLEGVSYRQIQRALGVPIGTLSEWKKAMGDDQFAEQRADRRARLIDAIWDAATEIVQEIRQKAKREEDLHKVVGAFAQLAAKGALLSGDLQNARASADNSVVIQVGVSQPAQASMRPEAEDVPTLGIREVN